MKDHAPTEMGPRMTPFERWVADATILHQDALRVATGVGAGTATRKEQTAATIAFIEKLHSLEREALEQGPAAFFGISRLSRP